jgi:hypothetical protein
LGKICLVSRRALLIVLFSVLSGCASKIADTDLSLIDNGLRLKASDLMQKDSGIYMVFELVEKEVRVIDMRVSMSYSKQYAIDQYNQGLMEQDNSPMRGCILIQQSRQYQACSREVFLETNMDVVGSLMGALLYPVTAVMVASGEGKGVFTNEDIDQESVRKIGSHLESIFVSRKESLEKALSQYNANLLVENKGYFYALTSTERINLAIKSVKTLQQAEQLRNIFAQMQGDELLVPVNRLNVRDKPSTRARKVKYFTKGKMLSRDEDKDGWMRVDRGWVYKKLLKSLKMESIALLDTKYNQIAFDINSQKLLAGGASSRDFATLLANKGALKGVSKAKLSKLEKKRVALVEKEAFVQAKNTSTVASFTSYITKYPSGKYLRKASQLREPLWFEQAKSARTVAAYKAFLSVYPNSQFFKTVRQQWFEIVSKRHAISGYRDFINGFPPSPLIGKAKEQLEPLWFDSFTKHGNYSGISAYLNVFSSGDNAAKLRYASLQCPEISVTFQLQKNDCVKNYLSLEALRNIRSFSGFAKAYALSNQASDFYAAQKLAVNDSEKKLIEYFALLALQDKSQLFNVALKDKHKFIGNSEHFTWFAQEKDSSAVSLKGEITFSNNNSAPIKIEYGQYSLEATVSTKLSYYNERRSNWAGNKDWTDKRALSTKFKLRLSSGSGEVTNNYDLGKVTVAYKDVGMMGGYTLYYLQKEADFYVQYDNLKPIFSLNLF